MAQAVRKNAHSLDIGVQLLTCLREGILIVFFSVAVFFFLAFVTHDPADPGWSHTAGQERVANATGVAGAWLSDLLFFCFGQLAYAFPLIIAYSGWLLLGRRWAIRLDLFHLSARFLGLVLSIAAGCGLSWLHGLEAKGGVLGNVVGEGLSEVFNTLGATVIMVALLLTGITLFTQLSWLGLMDTTGRYTLETLARLRALGRRLMLHAVGRKARQERETLIETEKQKIAGRPKPRIEPAVDRVPISDRAEVERQERLFPLAPVEELPPLRLLDDPPPRVGGYPAEVLQAMSRQVELKLMDFGIETQVVAVHPGPVITRFELQPAPGVKASRITSLSRDLARSLSTISVRVVEVIPGKSVIGLEIPNEQRELVCLREILGSREYEAAKSPLTMALGKDISGAPVVADLGRMPHLLVAGTTGSGKSVALNAMILSLLYKATVQDVRLILIDPKMLELSVYEGIPSLLAPVVTDMKEAANALRWCVTEMERRYRLMAALGVRNIIGFNRKLMSEPNVGDELGAPLERLPYIVVIVDELADMMMTVGKKVEELIARLAQKARASGIHLILATQRPSVDVITGLIKANIPRRIAFQVSSKVDSRTILDQMGAESLLGHGDMLYLPPGTAITVRVHGAFVSDQEVHKVADYLKSVGPPDYIEEVLEGPPQEEAGSSFDMSSEGTDALYDEAVRIVTETRRASISAVQRRLKIGYNRAARMLEEMERSGIIGELQANGGREVLAPPPPKD